MGLCTMAAFPPRQCTLWKVIFLTVSIEGLNLFFPQKFFHDCFGIFLRLLWNPHNNEVLSHAVCLGIYN